MEKKPLFALSFFLLVGCLVGCQRSENEAESHLSLVKITNPSPVQINEEDKKTIAKKIKKDVAAFNEIFDVAVIKGEKDTLVAYKVKHLQRFRMKQIEKKINKLLEENYPDEDFIVSSDYKIFMEAIQLKNKVKEDKIPQDEAEKQLQKIIELKEELT